MQVCTAIYRHLWSPVNPLMPGGNTRSRLKLQVCLSNVYDLLLPPDISGLKLIYIDSIFVTLH